MKKERISLFEVIIPIFIGVLIVSNVIAQKFYEVSAFGVVVSLDIGTILLFPLLYILGDIVPEVYGLEKAKRLIWYGFGANILSTILFSFAIIFPYSPYFTDQEAFKTILGSTPPLLLASMAGYLSGSFSNTYIMIGMKKWKVTASYLPLRTITSTFVGEFLDTCLFVSVASLFGIFPKELVVSLVISQWLIKTGLEVALTPVTVFVIKTFKKYEEKVYNT